MSSKLHCDFPIFEKMPGEYFLLHISVLPLKVFDGVRISISFQQKTATECPAAIGVRSHPQCNESMCDACAHFPQSARIADEIPSSVNSGIASGFVVCLSVN
jgi:hypothetical protein